MAVFVREHVFPVEIEPVGLAVGGLDGLAVAVRAEHVVPESLLFGIRVQVAVEFGNDDLLFDCIFGNFFYVLVDCIFTHINYQLSIINYQLNKCYHLLQEFFRDLAGDGLRNMPFGILHREVREYDLFALHFAAELR